MDLKIRIQQVYDRQQPGMVLREQLLKRVAGGAPVQARAGRRLEHLDGWQGQGLPVQCWAQVCALTERRVLAINRPQSLQFYGAF